jgi:hypothetical protein
MLLRRTLSPEITLAMAATLFGCLALAACSVNVDKNGSGEDKKVDIETPVGNIRVDKTPDVRDTGIAVYPGARIRQKESPNDDDNANVDLSFFGYGVKVVAVKYQSDDAPAKIVSFYKDQLKKYGSVLECRTSSTDPETGSKGDSQQLTCDSESGKNIELKVGIKDNQHIVAVTPENKGTSFSLVYVRLNKGNTI